MIVRLRTTLELLPRNLVNAAVLLVVITVGGTSAYMLIEGWSFLDALYMTVTTVMTIGFGEVRPLDSSGRVLTMILAILGVGGILYALLGFFQFVLEGELGTILGVQRMKRQIETLNDHYILCGFGRVGEEIAREFAGRHLPFVVIESNPEAIERSRQRGYLTLVGDATNDAILKEAGVERARVLLAASDSDAGNTFIALTAKALNTRLFTVSRAGQPDSEPRMLRAGADRVFSPYIIAGKQMALTALHPMAVEFIDTLSTRRDGGPVLAEIDVSETSGLAGRTIHDVLHTCRTVNVLGLQSAAGDLRVGADMSTVLRTGDRIIVMGQEEELETIRPGRARAAR